ncbi:hypothetical protein [Halopenitus persicus]|uniref:DUF5658 domain-containing protein n=1 Tax=Halopenitus persicus TaxID=1048396 RepID=A0A1H3IPQ6_9EURY|nr:hypothetical protein [Halopenitus persicus]QHS17177.1 hypothetical protein GWK26_08500 [haloarchaeon 3A1-DGR]SDY29587.1 hypothetical protein SAMN05216564_104208 [Halopenitus persicus]
MRPTSRADDSDPFAPSIAALTALTPWWWFGALAFFGAGDLLTTAVGLYLPTIVEASPVGVWIVRSFGIWTIAPVKVLLLGGFFTLWVAVPRPHNVGIPLGLCALGVLVTGWNLSIIVLGLV